MAKPNLQQVHDDLRELAYEAGHMMRAANPSTVTSGSKKNCTCGKALPGGRKSKKKKIRTVDVRGMLWGRMGLTEDLGPPNCGAPWGR